MGFGGGQRDEVCVQPATEVCEKVSVHSQILLRQYILAQGFIFAPVCSCSARVCSSLPQRLSIVFPPNHSLANFLLVSYLGFFLAAVLPPASLSSFYLLPLPFGSKAKAPSSDLEAP